MMDTNDICEYGDPSSIKDEGKKQKGKTTKSGTTAGRAEQDQSRKKAKMKLVNGEEGKMEQKQQQRFDFTRPEIKKMRTSKLRPIAEELGVPLKGMTEKDDLVDAIWTAIQKEKDRS